MENNVEDIKLLFEELERFNNNFSNTEIKAMLANKFAKIEAELIKLKSTINKLLVIGETNHNIEMINRANINLNRINKLILKIQAVRLELALLN